MKLLLTTLCFSLLIGLTPLAAAQNSAGKVIFTSGINKVIDTNGNERIAKRGAIVNAGDRIQTSTGRLQVRFNDNGFVSIKPRSELLIEQYTFNGQEDGSENAIFNLLKGSVRAITGLIGRKNKQAYQYKTPVATIGIRGTAFVLNYCNGDCFDDAGNPVPDGLYVNNGEGKVILTSAGGSIDLIRGQFAYVEDEDSAPQQLLDAPSINEQINLVSDELEDVDIDDLKEDIIQETLVNLDDTRFRSGFAVSSQDEVNIFGTEYNEKIRPLHDNDGFPITDVEGDTVVILEENRAGLNRLTGYGQVFNFTQDNQRNTYVDIFRTRDDATGRFGGNNDYGVIWGTWETGWINTVQFRDANGNIDPTRSGESNAESDYLFHYILSNQLTPIGDDGKYKIADTVLQYGSTSSLTSGGQVAYYNTGMASGANARYGEQRVFLEMDFGNSMLNRFEVSGYFGQESANRTFSGSMSAPQYFYGQSSFNFDDASCSADLCGGTGLLGSGAGTVEFLGQNADAAMGGYYLEFLEGDGGLTHVIGGTYLVEQTGQSDSPAVPVPTGIEGVMTSSILTESGSPSSFTFGDNEANNNITIDPTQIGNGNELLGFTTNNGALNFDSATPGTAQIAAGSQGQDATLGVSWGTWVGEFLLDGSAITGGSTGSVTESLHYVYSNNITPVNNLPTNGSVTFDNVIHGNASYLNDTGTSFDGSLSGDMTVNFQTATVTAFQMDATFVNPTTSTSTTDTFVLTEPTAIDSRGFSIAFNGGGTALCNVCGGVNPGNAAGDVAYEFLGENAEGVMGSLQINTVSESITGAFVLGANSNANTAP